MGKAHTRITLYSAPGCSHCKQTWELLKIHRIPFKELDVQRSPRARKQLQRLGASNSQYEYEPFVINVLDNSSLFLYKTLGKCNRISSTHELPLSTTIASPDLQRPGGVFSLNR